MTLLTFLLQAETAEAIQEAAATVATQEKVSLSMIDMAVKGGWLMIPLVLLSILAIYIFGMKWWTISRASKIDPNFMKDIRDYIHEGKISAAQNLCRLPTSRQL